jgi:hypothetical protein
MGMKTRCKFQVEKVTAYQGNHEQVTLGAVYGGVNASAENQSFADATSNGRLEITVTNPAVVGQIKPGQYYYLDLIPTEA